jgi:excisionase family DNA binding protein
MSETLPLSAKQSNQKILTALELCELTRLSRPTISRLTASGKLQCYRVGVRVLFDWERHVLPFLQSCEIKGRAVSSSDGSQI